MAEFITTTELIVKLNLPDDTEPTDRALQACVGATAAIREECGWHIWPAVTGATFTLDSGQLERLVILPALRVAVSAVVVDGVTRTASTYHVDSAAGTVMLDSGGRVIVVTYSTEITTVPEGVRDTCLDEAAARYTNPAAVQREAIDDYSVTYFPPPDLSTDQRLRAYRLGPAF